MIDKSKKGDLLGFNDVGKRELALVQVSKLQVFAVGIQEARSRQSSFLSHEETYYIIASGAENGNLGCEIWISLAHNLASSGKPIHVDPQFVVALHSEPRILLVHINQKGLALYLHFMPHGEAALGTLHVVSMTALLFFGATSLQLSSGTVIH